MAITRKEEKDIDRLRRKGENRTTAETKKLLTLLKKRGGFNAMPKRPKPR